MFNAYQMLLILLEKVTQFQYKKDKEQSYLTALTIVFIKKLANFSPKTSNDFEQVYFNLIF